MKRKSRPRQKEMQLNLSCGYLTWSTQRLQFNTPSRARTHKKGVIGMPSTNSLTVFVPSLAWL